jgi:hypothetical protein
MPTPAKDVEAPNGHANGHLTNGHFQEDAQEFELEGLTSEDEDEAEGLLKEGVHQTSS